MKLHDIYLWLIGKQQVRIVTLRDGTEEIAYTIQQFQKITEKGYSHHERAAVKKTRTPKPKRKFKLFKKRRNKIWEN